MYVTYIFYFIYLFVNIFQNFLFILGLITDYPPGLTRVLHLPPILLIWSIDPLNFMIAFNAHQIQTDVYFSGWKYTRACHVR